MLTFWSTLDPQADQTTDPEGWARFVGSTWYLVDHIFGAIGGSVLAILGVIALGSYLAPSRAGRLGLAAMVMTVVGQALSLVIAAVSTFTSNAVGRAYLAGMHAVMEIELPAAMTATFMLAIALAFVGSVLLGIAVWLSGTLPKWAGAVCAVMFYVLGALLGMATTGSSLITQPLAALLRAVSGGWIAWSAMRSPLQGKVANYSR